MRSSRTSSASRTSTWTIRSSTIPFSDDPFVDDTVPMDTTPIDTFPDDTITDEPITDDTVSTTRCRTTRSSSRRSIGVGRSSMPTEASACFQEVVNAGEADSLAAPLEMLHPECGVAEAYWTNFDMTDEAFFVLIDAARPCFLALVESGEIAGVRPADRVHEARVLRGPQLVPGVRRSGVRRARRHLLVRLTRDCPALRASTSSGEGVADELVEQRFVDRAEQRLDVCRRAAPPPPPAGYGIAKRS